MKCQRDLTLGEAARLLRLSPTTMRRLFDAGSLKGYRVPGSRFRRVTRAEVERLAREHDIPLHDPQATEAT